MGNPRWGGIVSGLAPLHSLLLQMLRCILIAFSLYAATGSMPNTSPLKTYSRNICFKMKILSNVQGVQKRYFLNCWTCLAPIIYIVLTLGGVVQF